MAAATADRVGAYAAELGARLEVERTADQAENARLLATCSQKELQRQGILLGPLNVASVSTGLGGRSLLELRAANGQEELPAHRFRNGDLARVEPARKDTNAPTAKAAAAAAAAAADGEQEISGVVHTANEKRIILALDDKLPDFLLDVPVRLVKLSNDLPYQRMLQAARTLPQLATRPSGRIVEIALGITPPQFAQDVPAKLVPFNLALNASQLDAVRFALSASDVAIIHGPPGTGKTTTLIEIIRQIIARDGPQTRILACGPSNISVDNLVERLQQTPVPIVRLGHPVRVLPKVMESTLEAILERSEATKLANDVRADVNRLLKSLKDVRSKPKRREIYAELKDLRRELRQREDAALQNVIRSSQVVLCTLSGAASRRLQGIEFDYVCIDEVSQALEAEAWIAASKAKRLILCGDPLQLPPTIKATGAAKKALETTLFDRFEKAHGAKIVKMLTVQYRMNEKIMAWASAAMYKNKLLSDPSVRDRRLSQLPQVETSELTDSPLLMIDTAGCNLYEAAAENGESRYNEGEAMIANQHVRQLIEAGIQEAEIAVITPYNAQVQQIRQLLKSDFPELEIGSVDGFQGREKEAIVISLVRSNDTHEVGFLAESRRLNVAITRAKRHVALICDSTTVERDAFLKEICEYFLSNGEVYSADMYDLETATNE